MKDRILLWNDDNHAPCVWINNKFAGVDLDRVIKNALYAQPVSKEGFMKYYIFILGILKMNLMMMILINYFIGFKQCLNLPKSNGI